MTLHRHHSRWFKEASTIGKAKTHIKQPHQEAHDHNTGETSLGAPAARGLPVQCTGGLNSELPSWKPNGLDLNYLEVTTPVRCGPRRG